LVDFIVLEVKVAQFFQLLVDFKSLVFS